MEIILAAALLPAIILMIYVYKQDTVEKETNYRFKVQISCK